MPEQETYYLIHTSEVDKPVIIECETLDGIKEELARLLDFYNIESLWEDFICIKGHKMDLKADKRRFFVLDGEEVLLGSDLEGPKIVKLPNEKDTSNTS